MDRIQPIINEGHIDYGENKVQEAIEKWTIVKQEKNHLKLHLIGKLQTNKVKYCLPLFDYIHSLDSIKLADKIANEQVKKNFPRYVCWAEEQGIGQRKKRSRSAI